MKRVWWIYARFVIAAGIACALGCSSFASAGPPDSAAIDADTCGFSCNGPTTPETLDASIARRVQLRLGLCNGQEGCHVSGAGGLTFTAGKELADVIDVRASERPELYRVLPGDPSASYLYLKVLGDGGIEGGRMPLGATYDPRISATIFTWIEAGAPAP